MMETYAVGISITSTRSAMERMRGACSVDIHRLHSIYYGYNKRTTQSSKTLFFLWGPHELQAAV